MVVAQEGDHPDLDDHPDLHDHNDRDDHNMSDHEEINVRLTAIETKIDIILADHAKRIDKLENEAGKHNAVYLAISAIGIGIGFGVKYLITGGGKA